MDWLPLLMLLLCPIMMIFCMKGHGGHKHHNSHMAEDINKKMSSLELENSKLRKEINELSSMVKKGS